MLLTAILRRLDSRSPRGAPVARPLCLLHTLFSALIAVSAAASASASAANPGPTVTEVVEFTRIIQPRNQDNDQLLTQVSPNGSRAFIVTRKADVRTDTNRFEILLLNLDPGPGAAVPQRLVAIDALRDDSFLDPSIQDARWIGDTTIVFRGRLRDAPYQVYKLDVDTRELVALTSDSDGILSFAVSQDLGRVVYMVRLPNPAVAPGARSVVVDNKSFWSVMFGHQETRAQERLNQYRVADGGSQRPARALGQPFAGSAGAPPALSISPDGGWAVVPQYAPELQLGWAGHYPMVAELTEGRGPSLVLDPLHYFSRPSGYVARRLVAYRLADGLVQPVVDAPDDAANGSPEARSDRLWQHDGKSLVIAGTHLPPDAGQSSPPDSASHIIEYWPDEGRWKDIAALKGRLDAAYAVRGERDGFVAIAGGEKRFFQRRTDGGWEEIEKPGGEQAIELALARSSGNSGLRIVQGPNQPPEVVAKDAAGHIRHLTTLNPQFSTDTWGKMRSYVWRDKKGLQWNGGLMTPANFDPRKRYPLVIQTYGFSEQRFYLDGSNMFEGYTSGFAGRAFMREGVLVLAMPWKATVGAPSGERAGVLSFMDGVKGAIGALVKDGVVDRDKIGIMGWSSTGERVLNLLTFSDAAIRAASIVDGDANTIFALTVTYGANDDMLVRKERINQGVPFGESLNRWIQNDPALHTDCIKAALRIETYGPAVLNNWDIYGLLRRQYKPTEMVVIPQGTHSLSRPSERMISLQGNVDWFRFWLSGEERREALLPMETAESLEAQYTRWRQMTELKVADDAKPVCKRLLDPAG